MGAPQQGEPPPQPLVTVKKVEMDNNFSPMFVNEVNRLKKRIVEHIEDSRLRKAFISVSNDILRTDPMLATFFVLMIRKMEEKEKSALIKEIIKTVHECTEVHASENIHMSNIYETTVDGLFIYAFQEGYLTTTQCIEGLVMTTDFTLRSRIDQRKWQYIRKSLANIDYKGIRNVLRFLLESQLRRLPQTLTSEQVAELKIVEDLILYIIDRETNLLPPLITLSEIMRGMAKQAFMMPRLASKLSQIAIHFRPIADLTHICGRSFIYPIPQHPSFVPYTSFWETESASQTPFVQSHHMLPYRPQHTTTFLYTLYMILRQPRGKDSFNPSHKMKTKSHWDILLSVMICEAMAEAETLGENDPIPRYQWDNIVNIVHYGTIQNLLNPTNFFSVLRGLIKSTHYTRARDEVMWIVLQIVGTFCNTPAFEEAIPEIVQLYRALFPSEVVWMGASDHPALLARFLAAASTWMLLEGKFQDSHDKLKPPNEIVKSHIAFITEHADKFDNSNTAMIAVLANAYRSDSKVGKMIPQIYQQRLEGATEETPIFQLSYGRQAVNRMTAFSIEFLDALTFRAKKTLLTQCFNCLRNFQVDKLPSPAVFDTMSRICQAVDYESAVKDVISMAHRSLHVVLGGQEMQNQMQAKDQCFFLFDFLCYRLSTVAFSMRHQFITSIFGVFGSGVINNANSPQLYQLFEQYLIRQFCWPTFHETIVNFNNLFGASKTTHPTIKYLHNPNSFVNAIDGKNFPFSPEIFRMGVINFMRALKVSGQEVNLEGSHFANLVTRFAWPDKMIRYFPKWAQELIANNSNNEMMKPNYTEIQNSVKSALNLHRTLTQPQFNLAFYHHTEIGTSHTILALIFRFMYDNREANLSMNTEFYEVIEKKTPRDMVIATNFLVDYLIAEVNNDTENNQIYNTVARVLSDMVFRWHFLRADRLLTSLVMHSTSDETSHLSILIIHEFCSLPEFNDRVKWFNNHVPRKEHSHSEYIRKIVEYHELYPEHEISEMLKGPKFEPCLHMPTYYGCLIERLLPIADFVISVTLEQHVSQSFTNLPVLQNLALLYKYHPSPIQFMYSILFTMHGSIKKPAAKTFVTTLQPQIEDVNFTEAFEKFNHQKGTQEQLIMELIDRISASLDFILTPPPHVAKDWKTAEFGPGAQSLYLACIELMASPHDHEKIVPAMINVLQIKPHLRPYNVVNLIALLITALPEDYANMLHKEFFNVLESGATAKLTFEELVFDQFEESMLLHLTNRSISINVVSQAYWTHCNGCFLNSFARQHVPKLMEMVNTENDLWYTLRLIIPIIRRFLEWQSDTAKHMRSNPEKFGPLFILRLIFERLGHLAEKGVEFEYEHHLCDLFYNCKYVFAGDFLRESAITEFSKLPPRMRDRLKFYVSQSETSSSSTSGPKEKEERNSPAEEPHKISVSATSSNANEQQAQLLQAQLLQNHPLPQQQSQQHIPQMMMQEPMTENNVEMQQPSMPPISTMDQSMMQQQQQQQQQMISQPQQQHQHNLQQHQLQHHPQHQLHHQMSAQMPTQMSAQMPTQMMQQPMGHSMGAPSMMDHQQHYQHYHMHHQMQEQQMGMVGQTQSQQMMHSGMMHQMHMGMPQMPAQHMQHHMAAHQMSMQNPMMTMNPQQMHPSQQMNPYMMVNPMQHPGAQMPPGAPHPGLQQHYNMHHHHQMH